MAVNYKQVKVVDQLVEITDDHMAVLFETSDARILLDLKNYKTVLKSNNISNEKGFMTNIIHIISKLYISKKILQNMDKTICKKLFARIVILFPLLGKRLFEINPELITAIVKADYEINKIISKLTQNQITEDIIPFFFEEHDEDDKDDKDKIVNNSIHRKLFVIIIAKFHLVARKLLQNNPKLLDIIKIVEDEIKYALFSVSCYDITQEQVFFLFEFGIIDVCSSTSKTFSFSPTYCYMCNDGQIIKYIDDVQKYIDDKIDYFERNYENNKVINYDEYKKMVIREDINDHIKKKHNITNETSILLQDIETTTNELLRNGDLSGFKKLFIVMPRDDSIGHWRLQVPAIAKKYYFNKIGTEIIVGKLHDTFITANFKLILWLLHITKNKEIESLFNIPDDIIFTIIKFLACKIGKNRDKPIVKGIYSL